MLDAAYPPRTLDRFMTAEGEWALRQRWAPDGPVWEIIANGVFLIDSVATASERALARLALASVAGRSRLRVLVGGLGLGFTARTVLDTNGVAAVDIVEVEPRLVDWVRGPVAHVAGHVLADARVRVIVADVADHLAGATNVGADSVGADTAYDAILLDVDNGPDWLVRDANREIYGSDGLKNLRAALRPGGSAAVWAADPSPGFLRRLDDVFGNARELCHTLRRAGRDIDAFIYIAERRS